MRSRTAIWTSETQATRALAAEIRHAPERSRQFFSSLLEETLVGPLDIALEQSKSRLDIALAFGGTKLGIEAKFGHEITAEQLFNQKQSCDRQILLVIDRNDVPKDLPLDISVTTWSEILSIFSQSRLTAGDIGALSLATAPKRNARSQFREIAESLIAMESSNGWEAAYSMANSGYPSLLITGPILSQYGHQRLTCQIEPERQASLSAPEGVIGYTATVGLSIDTSVDLDAVSGECPPWISAMHCLRQHEEELLKDVPLVLASRQAQLTRNSVLRPAPAVAARWDLPLMYAKGYQDSYLGVKFETSGDPVDYSNSVWEFLQRFNKVLESSL